VDPLLPSQPARSVKNVRASIAVQLIVFIFFPPYEDASEACCWNHGDLGLLRRVFRGFPSPSFGGFGFFVVPTKRSIKKQVVQSNNN